MYYPTNKLRFVERVISCATMTTARILQQWWQHIDTPENEEGDGGEWRDVPLEKE